MAKKLNKDDAINIGVGIFIAITIIVLIGVILAGKSKKKANTKLIKEGKKRKKGLGKAKDKIANSKLGRDYAKFAYYINPLHWSQKHYPG